MADGTVTIDLLMNTKSFMSDRERVNNLMKTLGADAGNQMDESFAKNSDKVQRKAKKPRRKLMMSLILQLLLSWKLRRKKLA